MKVEYMRTAKKSYMIVKEANFPYERYELSMILRNDIACLIPFQVILEDGEEQYWYDVGGMQSLKVVFSMGSLDGKHIRILLESLVELKSAMEEYLLDDMNICFSSEMICFDRAGERIRFSYIPGFGRTGESGAGTQTISSASGSVVSAPHYGLKELFEDILQHLDHADPSAVRMSYEMYERCARGPFTAEDCMDCLRLGEQSAQRQSGASVGEQEILWSSDLDEDRHVRRRSAGAEMADSRLGGIAGESAERHRRRSAPGPTEESEKEWEDSWSGDADDLEFFYEESGQKMGHRKKRKKGRDHVRKDFARQSDHARRSRESARAGNSRWAGSNGRFGNTVHTDDNDHSGNTGRPEGIDFPEDDGRTEIISEDFAERIWELVYKGNGVESDLVLSDFPFLVGTDKSRVNGVLHARTVSRVHAKLYVEENRLFVEDFNSTNGTYLNHNLMPMSTPSELLEGDRIVFATEEYAVYCRHI